MHNSITIYSNSITTFNRSYAVKAGSPTKISIPFRKTHIADVLSSLKWFGDVSVCESPSFTPTNVNESNLQLDDGKILESLISQLGGSMVAIEKNDGNKTVIAGKLGGSNQFVEDRGTFKLTTQKVVVFTNTGIKMVPMDEISNITFQESDINSEINKALSKKKQAIKPDSTFLDFSLESTEDATAVVQYVIPTAAWTPSYRISQEENKFKLEGYAVVHNNTEDDWIGFIVSVVVGDPHTFECDIDKQKTPTRTRINFVKSTAAGGVEAEVGMEAMALCDEGGGGNKYSGNVKSIGNVKSMARHAAPAMAASFGVGGGGTRAKVDSANAVELGDFTIWTAKNEINIPANRSALVPLFDVDLSEAKVVLYYKSGGSRPLRAIQFKNTTDWSLGYGPCAVYNDNQNEGSCALPACKSGEERLLIHAQENGVLIQTKAKTPKNDITQVVLKNGMVYQENTHRAETIYNIQNNKKESFTLLLDYDLQFAGDIESSHEVVEKLANGSRLKVQLKPKEKIRVTVTETLVQDSKIALTTTWMEQYFSINDLEKYPSVKEALEIQESITTLDNEIEAEEAKVDALNKEQKRLRENLVAIGGGNGEDTQEWRRNLVKSEKEIQALTNNRVPGLKKQKTDLDTKLDKALEALVVHRDNTSEEAN